MVTYACSDKFTEVNPSGKLNVATVANADGVDLLLVGAYSLLDGFYGGNDWHSAGDNWWFDAISDIAHKGSEHTDQADLHELEIFDWSTSNPYLLGKWKSIYTGVARANAVLVQAKAVKDADLSVQIAEARMLRGHYHFEAQRIWGNVPYISEENAADPNVPNTGPIWDKIEADIQFAIDNLPETQPEPGRVNKWTAKAYMGKVLLYQNKYAAAKTILTDVIDNGPYALNAEFIDNFTFAGKNGPESVFAIQFSPEGGAAFNGNRGGTLNFPQGGPFGSCCGFYQPTQDLVNSYRTNAGLPLLDTYNQSDVVNDQGLASFEADETTPTAFTPDADPLDPRLDFTVGRRDIDYNGFGRMIGKSWVRKQEDAGPYLPKKNIYQQSELGSARGQGGWGQERSGLNYNIIRFADVLLMAAEAEVEVGSLDKAKEYVNMVRNRAKNSTTVKAADGTSNAANYQIEPYAAFADQVMARKAVRFERKLELSMEGQRLFDLRRWGIAESVMAAFHTNEKRVITSHSSNPYTSKNDLFPIPIGAIDLSGGVLVQNPGY